MPRDAKAAGPAEDRARNITRGVGSLTIQNILSSILAFIFLAVLVRLVPYSDYNAYSSAQVSVIIAVTVSTFGLQYAAARYIAFYLQEEEKAWAAAKATLVLSLIFTGIVTVVFEIMAGPLSLYFTKSSGFTFFFELSGAWLFSYSISSTLQGVIQGMKRYTTLAKMLLISRVSMVIFTVLALEITHNVNYAIIAWVIYFAITILWPLKIIWHKIFKATAPNQYSVMMRYSTPLAIAAILAILSSTGDSVILGGYTQSLGVYNAVLTISSVLNSILVAPLIITLLPETSSSARTDLEVSNGTRLSLRLLVLGLLPVSLFVSAVSNQLVSLFSGGGNYLQGVESLEIISGTFILVGMQSVAYSILQALGKTVQALAVGAIMALADISFSLLFIPNFGIIGATASKVSVMAIGAIVTIYLIKTNLRTHDSFVFYSKAIASAVTPSLVVFILSSVLSNRVISLVPYAMIWAIVFLACAKLLRLFTDEDRAFLMHLTPSPMQKFLKYL